jgi:class 3 adenylate cyclase
VEIFTFLFTDIEGSTAMLRRLGAAAYAQVLADHHDVIRSGLAAHEGEEVDTQGDAFFAVFSAPGECVAAAVEMQRAIGGRAWPAAEQVRVRMGIHTGAAAKTETGLVGLDVHRAARLAAVAYGGQILVSEATAVLVRDTLPPGAVLRDLGLHRLKAWAVRSGSTSWTRPTCRPAFRRCGHSATRPCRTISRSSRPHSSAATPNSPKSGT